MENQLIIKCEVDEDNNRSLKSTTSIDSETESNLDVPSLKRNYKDVNEKDYNYEYINLVGISKTNEKLLNIKNPFTSAPIKRCRRAESSLLFEPPFFKLQLDPALEGGNISAICLSCQTSLRGHKNVSSNFIKHLKRTHPELYKYYEHKKLFRNRGLNKPIFDTISNNLATQSDIYLSAVNCMNVTSKRSEQEYPQEQGEDESKEHIFSSKNSEATSFTNSVELSETALNMMSSLLDEKLKNFVTKNELNNTTEIITNFLQSNNNLNSSSVSNNIESQDASESLQTQLNNLRQECQELRLAVKQTQQSKRQLHREMQLMDKKLRRNKFHIYNLPLAAKENPYVAVDSLLRDRLQLPNILLNSVNIVPNNTNPNRQNLIVELKDEKDAACIFRNCFKLKNSGIFIESDMSRFAFKRKEKLTAIRKELMRRNSNLTVLIRNAEMIVSGKYFFWDDFEGLCSAVDDSNAVESLKNITGIDLTEFLNILKNYDVR